MRILVSGDVSELILTVHKKLIVGLYRNWKNRSGTYIGKLFIYFEVFLKSEIFYDNIMLALLCTCPE